VEILVACYADVMPVENMRADARMWPPETKPRTRRSATLVPFPCFGLFGGDVRVLLAASGATVSTWVLRLGGFDGVGVVGRWDAGCAAEGDDEGFAVRARCSEISGGS